MDGEGNVDVVGLMFPLINFLLQLLHFKSDKVVPMAVWAFKCLFSSDLKTHTAFVLSH